PTWRRSNGPYRRAPPPATATRPRRWHCSAPRSEPGAGYGLGMAATETLTAERILEATEEVLRRHGPAKATVVDVARALGVSHGTVYRHFRTKAALREAVTKRWLDRTSEALGGIADDDSRDPEARLRDWLATLFAAKRRKAGDDPELFATYSVLAGEQGAAVAEHIDDLTGQRPLPRPRLRPAVDGPGRGRRLRAGRRPAGTGAAGLSPPARTGANPQGPREVSTGHGHPRVPSGPPSGSGPSRPVLRPPW